MRTTLIVLAVAAALVVAAPASAAMPESANCWGTVVAQRASTYHDLGEHSSSQTEPRRGVGQLAHKDFGMSVGEAGAFLAQLDDSVGQDPLGATHCP
jgi:hypothetical protein